MISKEFIPYEQALALKELGFVELCFGWYSEEEKKLYSLSSHGKQDTPDVCLAPIYQQAFRWFREKYNLQHELTSIQENSWLITIRDISLTTRHGLYIGEKWDCDDLENNIPHTYEEAEFACLKKLIEIVNQNKDE